MLEIFGPVPSRRLGQSLGINTIPPKHCTYACIYCQLGNALHMSTQIREFLSPKELSEAVKQRLEEVKREGKRVDYLTIVPDGEPTLDKNLKELILRLKEFLISVAVITNGTLVGRQEVREALLEADWVSVKVDAISLDIWKRIDRPHKDLDLEVIKSGLLHFASQYKERPTHLLMTESMLVEGVNTSSEELERMAKFINSLSPNRAYLSIPTRPPAISSVMPASEESLTRAYAIYSTYIDKVEYLIGYEGNEFSNSGDSRKDLLSITAVHPMRDDAVKELLQRNGDDYSIVTSLVDEKLIIPSTYGGHTFYVRDFSHHR